MIEIFETNVIPTAGGKVRKFVDSDTKFLEGFGEIYFSEVEKNFVKGWKCHLKYFCHISIPVGAVKFVFVCEKKSSNKFHSIVLSCDTAKIIKIHPNTWFAFQGLYDGINLVANVLNGVHDPIESKNKALKEFSYEW